MKSREQLQLELESNLGLIKELGKRTLRIRGILEEKLVRHPLYESIERGINGRLEGFGCNLIGEFEVHTVGEFGGEYNLRLSANCSGNDSGNLLNTLIGREIAITGYAAGFGPIDYKLVTLSSIKGLGYVGLRELQDKLTELEFLLKTIGLLPDGEVDPEGM